MATFAIDQDLFEWEPDLLDYVSEEQADFQRQHIATGKHIIEDLINSKIIEEEEQILRPQELNEVAIFKTLGMIFNWLSANPDDKFRAKSDDYEARFESKFIEKKSALTIDLNKDGFESKSEVQVDHAPTLERQ